MDRRRLEPVIFSDRLANGVPVVEAQLDRREAAAELTCNHKQAMILRSDA